MALPTPNYLTTEEITVSAGFMRDKVLPVHSFVRPIEYQYLPAHVKNNTDWKWINLDTFVFCYTHLGIIPIQKSIIRRA